MRSHVDSLNISYLPAHFAFEAGLVLCMGRYIKSIHVSLESSNHCRQKSLLSHKRERTGSKAPKHVDIRSSSHLMQMGSDV